jgi:ATP-dependent DNA helicase RecG
MMVQSNDGFVLAEKDLELRGPGEFIGTRQSGLPEMSWLDGSFDIRLLDKARETAEALLKADPHLRRPEHMLLKSRYEQFWLAASPDLPIS